MRFLRAISVPVFALVLPGFIAFQVAARPMLSCGENPCELLLGLMPCMSLDGTTCDDEMIEIVAGCCSAEILDEPSGGCCAQEELPPPCSGCNTVEEIEPLCAKGNNGNEDCSDGKCPAGLPFCAVCPTIPIAAEPAQEQRTNQRFDPTLPTPQTIIFAIETLSGSSLNTIHAPPFSALTRAGPDQRVMMCSFLL